MGSDIHITVMICISGQTSEFWHKRHPIRSYIYTTTYGTPPVTGAKWDDTLWPLNVIDQRIYTNFIVTCCFAWLQLQICKLPPLDEGGATGLQLIAAEFSFQLVPVIKRNYIRPLECSISLSEPVHDLSHFCTPVIIHRHILQLCKWIVYTWLLIVSTDVCSYIIYVLYGQDSK